MWSMEGKLLRQWDAAAAGRTLTALNLDTPKRRLLTAFDDGSGKVGSQVPTPKALTGDEKQHKLCTSALSAWLPSGS